MHKPRILSPPRAFISYRWESQEHMNWVADFAKHLARRRVDVVLDKFLDGPPLGRGRHPSEVVQRMQGCHIFIPVFTPGYLARIVPSSKANPHIIDDAWVFDEWQLSLHLGHNKLIETLGVLRSGDFADLPQPFNSRNTVDLRTTEDYARKLNSMAYYMRFERAVTAPGQNLGAALDDFFDA